MHTKDIISLIDITNKFSAVERSSPNKYLTRCENDSEHSFQLALICWQLNESFTLELNLEHIFKYALCHDLVEVHAGDTDPHTSTPEYIDSKETREANSLLQLETEIPASFIATIHEYETKQTPEARFVYILDKFVPILNTHHAGNTYYKDNKVTEEKWFLWLQNKLSKIKIDPIFSPVIQDIEQYIRENSSSIFYTK